MLFDFGLNVCFQQIMRATHDTGATVYNHLKEWTIFTREMLKASEDAYVKNRIRITAADGIITNAMSSARMKKHRQAAEKKEAPALIEEGIIASVRCAYSLALDLFATG